jgi:tetratricopeptide (TPR) repeat protein
MKQVLTSLASLLLILSLCASHARAQRKPAAQTGKKPTTATKPAQQTAGDDALKSELDEIAKLNTAERVERLEAFVKAHADSPLLPRAQELLTSARAALGDEKLRTGDHPAGVELFREAVKDAPAAMSDKLFDGVVSQIPANLYLLGERDAAFEIAREVEGRASGNAQRLLAVASFYLNVERPDDAARVAQAALALQPDSAAAHQALGMAYRYALRLEDAAAEFQRAHELDPTSASARRILAELRRATGKPGEALALYREQLAADPQDANARTGLVLSLFDAGKRDEAERELQSALTGEAKDLPLLVGASYWYSAHGDGARALELAEKAVAFEPHFGWAWTRIAEGRALLALKRPLEAERAFRVARAFGNFPTLDYELAAALAAAGLYDEAGEQLSHSFVIRDGQIETGLAGHVEAHASDFNDLLAPERRASLSQFAGASSDEEARVLKALLAFRQATSGETADERAVADAARAFGAGDDAMRAYRNLYAAEKLEQRGVAPSVAFERADAAISGVEPALDLPQAPVALYADTEEMRALHQQLVETGAPITTMSVQRDVLSKSLRGRIEELAGWALYNEGQAAEAVVRLRRAVSVLPEEGAWWRSAEWRLGAALESSGSGRDALVAYIASYRAQPDPTHYAVIESLYKRLNNGSLDGLDQLLQTVGATRVASATLPTPAATAEPTPARTSGAATDANSKPATTDASAKSTTDTSAKATGSDATTWGGHSSFPITKPTPSPAASVTTPTTSATPATAEATPEPSTTPAPAETAAKPGEPKPSAEQPAATPSPTPAAETTPTPATAPSPTPEATPQPTPTPAGQTQTPETTAAAPVSTPTPQPSPEQKPETKESGGACALAVGEESLSIKPNGGSATVTVSLENYSGATPPRINPSTDNWADIIILAEPHAASDGNAQRFTVSSISAKTGTFAVTFASPCGKRQVTVNVK